MEASLSNLAARAAALPAPREEIGPLRGRCVGKKGPTLVLIHGLGRVAAAWVALVEELKSSGWPGRIVFVDNPGLGASRKLSIPGSTDRHAALVQQTLDAFELGDEELHIAGLSFGGMIASALAARLGARASSVVAMAPSAMETAVWRITGRAITTNLKGMLPGKRLSESDFLPLVLSAARHAGHPELADELQRLQRNEGGGGVSAAARQLWAATWFRLGPYRKAQPARRAVIVGTADGLVPVKNSRRYAKLTDSKLFTIEGAGHDLGLDAPRRIAAWLVAWQSGASDAALAACLAPPAQALGIDPSRSG